MRNARRAMWGLPLTLGVSIAACTGRVYDLGGATPAEPGDGAAENTSSLSAVGDSGSTPAACPAPGPVACFDVPSVSACPCGATCNDGSGLLLGTRAWCADAPGAAATLASPADVAATLVGTWASCGAGSGSTFIETVASGADAIQFTSDGQFLLYGYYGDDAPDAGWPFDLTLSPLHGTANGTFTVVDASATLGPGTFQVRLTAPSGGVYTSQILVYGSPPRFRVFSPSAEDYTPAVTKAFEAKLCGPPLGVPYDATSYDDLVAHLSGRWAACDNNVSNGLGFDPGGQGLEMTSDGHWYALFEDASGALVRATDPGAYGTYQQASGGNLSIDFTTTTQGTWEVTADVDQCGGLVFDFAPTLPDEGPSTSHEYRRLSEGDD